MPEYRIENSRHDVPKKVAHKFTASDNNEARKTFMTFTKSDHLLWDDLYLVKVIAPASLEVVKIVSLAIRQGRAGQEIIHY